MASFNIKRFIKNPIKGLENALRSTGKIVRQGAPLAGLIPGVGPGIGAALGYLGSVAEGRGMDDHWKSGLAGGLSGLGNSQLLGGKGIGGVQGAVTSGLKKIGIGGAANAAGTLPNGNLPDGTEYGMEPVGGGDGFGWDDLGGWGLEGLKKLGGGGLDKWIDRGLGAAGIAAGVENARKADKYRKHALDLVTGQWNEGEPLRDAGMAGMLNTERPDLSSTFADPNNPFAQQPLSQAPMPGLRRVGQPPEGQLIGGPDTPGLGGAFRAIGRRAVA